MRVGLGQFNALVGDLAGNAGRMREIYAQAVKEDINLLIFPELSVCGYPPEDLLHKNHFIADCMATVEKLAADFNRATVVVGYAGSCAGRW